MNWFHLITDGVVSNYAASVGASVAAALLWQLTGYLTGRFRTPLDIISSIAGGGVVQTYPDFQRADRDIDRYLSKSTTVRYLSLRGFPISQETYALHKSLEKTLTTHRHLDCRVMVLEPHGKEARDRAIVYSKLGPETRERYVKQIEESIQTMLEIGDRYAKFELRTYDQAAAFRLLMLDDACFVGFYTRDLRGATSPVLRMKKGSLLYKTFDYYYERVWAHGKVVEKVRPQQPETVNDDDDG